MRFSFMFSAAMIVCLGMAGTAMADTLLYYKTHTGQTSSKTRMYVRAGEIRISHPNGRYILYKSHADTVYIVQPRKKSYTAIDRATIETLTSHMGVLRLLYRQQIKKLPPEQRARMKRQLGPLLNENSPPIHFSKTGTTKTVSGYRCEKAVVKRAGRKLTNLCLADPGALGLAGAEYDTIKRAYALLTLVERASGVAKGVPDITSLHGVPIAFERDENHANQRMVLQKVSHEHLSNALFELPKNYTVRALPGL